MATKVCAPQCEVLPKTSSPQVVPQSKFHSLFSHTTHSFLKVRDDSPGSPQPDNFDVLVFNPSKNINIPINLKSTDTADTLIKKYQQTRPELGKDLRLAFNGKPVEAHAILRDLGVKPGAMFITFQRCHGG